jgi:hypothetical protein
MNDAKYIGLDVHQATISVAVRDSAGKLVIEAILETKAETILQFLRGLRGSLHVTFEEGTWAPNRSTPARMVGDPEVSTLCFAEFPGTTRFPEVGLLAGIPLGAASRCCGQRCRSGCGEYLRSGCGGVQSTVRNFQRIQNRPELLHHHFVCAVRSFSGIHEKPRVRIRRPVLKIFLQNGGQVGRHR